MIMWGNNAASNTSVPKWASMLITAGSGFTNRASNNNAMFQNSSPENFAKSGHNPFQASGIFALSPQQHANTTGETLKCRAGGWNLREAFEGPIIQITVTAPGSTFANGEVILFSNSGSASSFQNGYGVVTTNSSGNMVSAAIGPAASFNNSIAGGRFMNTSIIVTSFVREKHLLTITASPGGTGYSNTDTITASNGFVNGFATVTTNTTGGITAITPTANSTIPTGLGLWGNAVANSTVVLTAFAANGSPSAGSGATFTANLTTSTGGSVTVLLGGRAGRVQYECIVAMTSMLQGNNTILPS